MGDYIYVAYDANQNRYMSINRDEVLDWYVSYNGVKVCAKTKDLFPEVITLIDEPNVDIRLFRKGVDIMNKTPISTRKAIDKYQKQNIKQVKFKLNYNTDEDILKKLETVDNIQGYLKELIRKDIQKNKTYN